MRCIVFDNELNIHTGDVSISMDGRNSTTTATTTQSKLHLMRMFLHLHTIELNIRMDMHICMFHPVGRGEDPSPSI